MDGTEMAQFVLTKYDTDGFEVNYVAGCTILYPAQLYVSITNLLIIKSIGT